MRRTQSELLAMQVLRYLRLENRLAEGYKQKYERLYRELKGNATSLPRIKIKMFGLGFAVAGIVLLAILSTELRSDLSVLSEILRLILVK